MNQVAPLPDNEIARLNALREYEILDTPAESDFDDLTQIAAHICGAPIALVSLIDESRQWFKAKTGLDAQETPRDIAFCAHAICDPDTVLHVTDATKDNRFKANPLVTDDPGIRFYAGTPLITPDGYAMGTLCVIDREPKQLTATQLAALEALGRQVIRNLELQRTIRNLERSNSDLESFAFIASHDLKEPLRTISSFTEILRRQYSTVLDNKAVGFMDHIVNGAKRMRTLVDDLLKFSQLGADELILEPVDTSSIVRQITDDSSAQLESLGATIEADKLPTVYADRSQLAMLLGNLIGNALKYHGDQAPQVRISADAQAGQWLFCVSDNGIGIEPENHAQVFDIFKRLHSRDKIAGSGIGLTVCKRIVQRWGGRIWLESQAGKGAQFLFTIPRDDPDP